MFLSLFWILVIAGSIIEGGVLVYICLEKQNDYPSSSLIGDVLGVMLNGIFTLLAIACSVIVYLIYILILVAIF